jgi:hypothetical protein
MSAWLAGAPYVLGGLVLLHLAARLNCRLLMGRWHFVDGGDVLFAHLLAAPLLFLAYGALIEAPIAIGLWLGGAK